MNATVKFREGQRPLFRLKLPVNIVGVPLQTGLTVGTSDELGLQLGTCFEAGPSWRFKYCPNDGSAPSVVLKTGLGKWGSSSGAALSMSAEWDLRAGGGRFMVRLKPRIGDFSLRHSSCADYTKDSDARADNELLTLPEGVGMENRNVMVTSEQNGSASPPRSPCSEGSSESIVVVPSPAPASGPLNRPDTAVKASMEASSTRGRWNARSWVLNVHSALPLGRTAIARARWSVKFPREIFDSRGAGIGVLNLKHRPLLALDKVSIEMLEGRKVTVEKPFGDGGLPERLPPRAWTTEALGSELEQMTARMQESSQWLQDLHSGNSQLRQAVEELKRELQRREEGWKGNGKNGKMLTSLSLDMEESLLRAQSEESRKEQLSGREKKPKGPGSKVKVKEQPTDWWTEPVEPGPDPDSTQDISERLREALAKKL